VNRASPLVVLGIFALLAGTAPAAAQEADAAAEAAAGVQPGSAAS